MTFIRSLFLSLSRFCGTRKITSLSPEAVSSNTTCGLVPDYAMHFMRPATLTNDLPWTGVVFGITISGVWYWCTDQVCLPFSSDFRLHHVW